MANNLVLFGRPLAFDTQPEHALTITGTLDGYQIGEAYSSSLLVENAIGKFRVEVLESSLPGGSTVSADNVADTIVVAWPAYTSPDPGAHDVYNGEFDNGSLGWTFDNGWDIDPAYGYNSTSSAVFKNVTGEFFIVGDPVPAAPNDRINLGCWVQQGASSKNKAGGNCFLRWYDEFMNVIKEDYAAEISSGKKGEWQETRINVVAPLGTAFVSPGGRAFRKSQNNPVWLDNFNWDHKYVAGDNSDPDWTLSLKVTDSANQVAYWNGVISITSYAITSLMYQLDTVLEQITARPSVVAVRLNETSQFFIENISARPSPVSAVIADTIRFQTYAVEAHPIGATPTPVSAVVTTTIAFKTYNVEAQPISATPTPVSGVVTVVIAYKTVAPYDLHAIGAVPTAVSAVIA